MKARIAFSFLALVAATAVAQDGAKPKEGKPAAPPIASAPPATAPTAKKERKTTPEAEAAIKKYASLLHFPNSKYKTLEMNSHCDVAMAGGEVGCKFVVKDDGTVTTDVTLSDAAKAQYGAQLKDIKRGIANQVDGFFRPFLVPFDVMAKQYDLASRVEKGKTIVQIARFDEHATWDKATLTFNDDGLLEKQVGTLNIDPNDQMGAMYAGVELETKLAYKKRGDLYTIESVTVTDPMGESSVKASYYEIDGTAPLPKSLDVTTPFIPEVQVFVHDFVVDGKKIAGTERKDEPKPAPAAPKPADPSKPESPQTPPKAPAPK
jgi:hypothetical protein